MNLDGLTVTLIENFLSFQGEGPDSGKSMLILRFKECDRVVNKKPCPWCDTIVKMRISTETEYSLNVIQNIINENSCGILITGGEPTFAQNLRQTSLLLTNLTYSIANVETNGYNLIDLYKEMEGVDKKIRYIYSPKIFNMRESKDEVKIFEELLKHNGIENTIMKLVAEDTIPVNHFIDYVTVYHKYKQVYLMPQGKNKEELIKNAPLVFDMAEKYKVNFSSRDHIIYDFI